MYSNLDVNVPYFDVDHEVGTVDPVSKEGLRIRLVDGDKVGDEDDDAVVEVVVIFEVVDDDDDADNDDDSEVEKVENKDDDCDDDVLVEVVDAKFVVDDANDIDAFTTLNWSVCKKPTRSIR
jgi:hypothetical protein